MRICSKHWQMMRKAIEERGLSGLIAKDGEAAAAAQRKQLEEFQAEGKVSEELLKETFDPLMSMNWHFANGALAHGGLYLMGTKDDGSQYCPICEYETHMQGFDAEEQIGSVADQMREYCVENHLIAKPS